MELVGKDKRKLVIFIIVLPVIGALTGLLFGIAIYWLLSLFVKFNYTQKNIAIWGMTSIVFYMAIRTSWGYIVFLRKNHN
jgi:hypothetical protein